jgi:hypothetical protein
MPLQTTYRSVVITGFRLEIGRPGVIILAEGSNPVVRLSLWHAEGRYSLVGAIPIDLQVGSGPDDVDPVVWAAYPGNGIVLIDQDNGILSVAFPAEHLVVPANKHFRLRVVKAAITSVFYGRLHIADF